VFVKPAQNAVQGDGERVRALDHGHVTGPVDHLELGVGALRRDLAGEPERDRAVLSAPDQAERGGRLAQQRLPAPVA
jgi:hypothetical protein